MRILLLTETWRPAVDGVVTRLDHTVRELLDRSHQVRVLAPTTDPSVPVDQVRTAGVVIPFVDRHRRWGIWQPGLPALVDAFRPTVVHVVNPVMFGSAAVHALASRHPLVASIHTDLAGYAAHYRLGFTRPALRALNRASYRRADVRLATSEFGAQLLADLDVGPSAIWPAAVDAAYAAAWRPRQPPTDRSPVRLLGVGRLAPEKAWEALLPLLRLGRLDGRELQLTLVGDGPDRARLERLFAGTTTRFTGFLRGAALVQAYAGADVLLSTSTSETVGLTLLEATATGLPVVAVDSPQLRATMRDRGRLVVVGPEFRTNAGRWAAAVREATGPAPADATPGVRPPTWAEATSVLLEHYATAAERFTRATVGHANPARPVPARPVLR